MHYVNSVEPIPNELNNKHSFNKILIWWPFHGYTYSQITLKWLTYVDLYFAERSSYDLSITSYETLLSEDGYFE